MTDRKCPECGDRLAFDAIRCPCGWGSRKVAKGERIFDHRCTFMGGRQRCEYPVGMFPEGAISGWCIFHRQGGYGDEIVAQSKVIPYLRALKTIQDRHNASAGAIDTSWAIARRLGDSGKP